MSDTLQLVVEVPYTQHPRAANAAEQFLPGLSAQNVDDKLKRIGHSLSAWKVDLFL